MSSKKPTRTIMSLFAAIFLIIILNRNVFAGDEIVYNANDWPYFKNRTKQDVQAKYQEVINNLGTYDQSDPASYFAEQPSTVSPYSYGSITSDTLRSMGNMVNFYRWLIGVNEIPAANFIARDDLQAQMLLRLWNIGHYVDQSKLPPDIPQDILDMGLPINHNILAWGLSPLYSIPQWLDEGRGDNPVIGHRYAILSSINSQLGFGYSFDFHDAPGITFRGGAIGDVLNYLNPIPDRAYFAYPAPGYQPKNFFGYNSSAWTIELNSNYLSAKDRELNIKVTWLNNGQIWQEDQTSQSDLILFAPVFEDISRFEDTDQFKVEITGLTDVQTSSPAKIEYTTEFISYEEYDEIQGIDVFYKSGDGGWWSNSLYNDIYLFDEYLNPQNLYAKISYANGETSTVSGRMLSIEDNRTESRYYQQGLPFFHEITFNYKGFSDHVKLYLTNKPSDKDVKSSDDLFKTYYTKGNAALYETRDSEIKVNYSFYPGMEITAIQDGTRYLVRSGYYDMGYIDASDLAEDLSSVFATLYYVKTESDYWDSSVGETHIIPVGDSFYGEIDGEEVYFRRGDDIFSIPKTNVTTTPIQSNAYVTERANVRSESSGQIIGTKYKGDYIQGYMRGNYLYFNFNGTDAKIHRSLVIIAKPQTRYLKGESNVRDRNGKLTGVKKSNQTIYAVQIGNQFRFVENNQIRFIHESRIIKDGEQVTAYLTNTSNIRYSESPYDVLYVLPIGTEVNGYFENGKFFLSYYSTIHPSLLTFERASNYYIKSSGNIRDQYLEKTDIAYKGNIIKAVKVGNYYRFEQNDQVNLIHESLVSKTPVSGDAYLTERANIRDLNNNLVTTCKRGTYIYGQRRGDYVYFTRNGKQVKVYAAFVKFASPRTMTIIERANIRNQDLEIVSVKQKGQRINAVRIGNYYRFIENGKIRFVWYSLVR